MERKEKRSEVHSCFFSSKNTTTTHDDLKIAGGVLLFSARSMEFEMCGIFDGRLGIKVA